jgi:hypothetical protein
MEIQKRKFYLNPISQLYLACDALLKVFIGGRGIGKSFGNGLDIADDVQKLPRAKTIFLGLTYTQIYTNVLLPLTSALETLGYVRDIHFVIGRKPPKGFTTPYQKPERYENVITFWNGYSVILASFDRPQLIRGGSNDGIKTDEALLIKKDVYDETVIPTLRPSSIRLFGKPKMLHQHFTSSMPYAEKGRWLLEYEEKAKLEPKKYGYFEGTSWHNRKVLGDETILRWKDSMSDIRYGIEVMNKRIFNIGNRFYKSLSEDHFYDEDANYDFVDGLEFNRTAIRVCRWDADCLFDQPLDISLDFGNFTCMWVAQEHRLEHTYKLINTFHTDENEILDDVCTKFCEYYKYKLNRLVIVYGDKMGKYKGGNTRYTQFETVERVLSAHGFRVHLEWTGDVDHLDRHDYVNQLLRHENKRLPMLSFNRMKTKDAKISFETTQMIDGQKDKRPERQAIAQKHAPHYGDAFDYLVFPKFKALENQGSLPDRAGAR